MSNSMSVDPFSSLRFLLTKVRPESTIETSAQEIAELLRIVDSVSALRATARREAMEEASRVCETEALEFERSADQSVNATRGWGPEELDAYVEEMRARAATANDCAKRILALASSPPPEAKKATAGTYPICKCGHHENDHDDGDACSVCECAGPSYGALSPSPPEEKRGCKRCGKPRLDWQVFCGAACSAQWEAGGRPTSSPPGEREAAAKALDEMRDREAVAQLFDKMRANVNMVAWDRWALEFAARVLREER